jgi:hypothetical protein
MKHTCATMEQILGRKPGEDGRYWVAVAAADKCIGGTRADTIAARSAQFSDVYRRTLGFSEKKERNEY